MALAEDLLSWWIQIALHNLRILSLILWAVESILLIHAKSAASSASGRAFVSAVSCWLWSSLLPTFTSTKLVWFQSFEENTSQRCTIQYQNLDLQVALPDVGPKLGRWTL